MPQAVAVAVRAVLYQERQAWQGARAAVPRSARRVPAAVVAVVAAVREAALPDRSAVRAVPVLLV
jgi:hypothetical protein